jgi:hypothetical protein
MGRRNGRTERSTWSATVKPRLLVGCDRILDAAARIRIIRIG